jgi:hypothetical protein
MSAPIAVETFNRELFDLLDETYEHTQWVYLDRGASLFETLESMSADRCFESEAARGRCPEKLLDNLIFFLLIKKAATGC